MEDIHTNREQRSNTKDFFFRKNVPVGKTISKVQSRVYGITRFRSEEIRNPVNIFGAIPYLAHNGINWQKFSDDRLQEGLYNQLDGGRGVEMILCETLISLELPGFHFLPTKEFDLSYKTDLISRVPYTVPIKNGKKLETLSIGSQITVMEIPENMGHYNSHDRGKKKKKYNDKLAQVELMNQYLHLSQTRKELEIRYGKLTVPDIMCFIAVNGSIRKMFGSQNHFLHEQFQKWKADDFQSDSLVENFPESLRKDIYTVAQFISWSQQYISSKDFLYHRDLKKNQKLVEKIDDSRNIIFDPSSGKLEIFLISHQEILCKITYLFIQDDIKKLQKNYTQSKINEAIK